LKETIWLIKKEIIACLWHQKNATFAKTKLQILITKMSVVFLGILTDGIKLILQIEMVIAPNIKEALLAQSKEQDI
jgi:hypothetical protein